MEYIIDISKLFFNTENNLKNGIFVIIDKCNPQNIHWY